MAAAHTNKSREAAILQVLLEDHRDDRVEDELDIPRVDRRRNVRVDGLFPRGGLGEEEVLNVVGALDGIVRALVGFDVIAKGLLLELLLEEVLLV